jgi:bifunctional DNA primase/polymerase-like protein
MERAEANLITGKTSEFLSRADQYRRSPEDHYSRASLGAMAALYAERGWLVLPLHSVDNGSCTCRLRERCNSAGKHPRCRNGVHSATTDLSVISEWWRRWPNANIGIATGKPSGFDVLDIDPRNGGDDTLRELELTHGPIPQTAMSITGGLGCHYLFRHNPEVGNGNRSIASGIDMKTTGGYIVAPPSVHSSGSNYWWEGASHPDDVGIANMPDWLLNLIRERRQRPEPPQRPQQAVVQDRSNGPVSHTATKVISDGKEIARIVVGS